MTKYVSLYLLCLFYENIQLKNTIKSTNLEGYNENDTAPYKSWGRK
jgi:hypothetical protein